MRSRAAFRVVGGVIVIAIVAAIGLYFLLRGDTSKMPETAAVGPSPTLPDPVKSLLPTVHIAPAKGWPEGAKPTAAGGFGA